MASTVQYSQLGLGANQYSLSTRSYSPVAEYRQVRTILASPNRPKSTRRYSLQREWRVPYGTPNAPQTEYRRAESHRILARYSPVLASRRHASENGKYCTVLQASGTCLRLAGQDPKKGIFENGEYRTVLGRHGRLHDFENGQYRTVLGQRG